MDLIMPCVKKSADRGERSYKKIMIRFMDYILVIVRSSMIFEFLEKLKKFKKIIFNINIDFGCFQHRKANESRSVTS